MVGGAPQAGTIVGVGVIDGSKVYWISSVDVGFGMGVEVDDARGRSSGASRDLFHGTSR